MQKDLGKRKKNLYRLSSSRKTVTGHQAFVFGHNLNMTIILGPIVYCLL